jgi:hypothetical protein
MRSRPAAVALLASLATAAPAWAQAIPDFNKLRTPVSPAFVVLGVSVASIARPTTPAALASSLLSDFSSGVLPRSYAAEAAPYWWSDHPGLTLSEYERGGAASLYRDLTLSLAITDSVPRSSGGSVAAPGQRRLGFGARTTLVSGAALDTRCVQPIDQVAGALSVAVGGVVARWIGLHPDSAGNAPALERVRAAAFDSARKHLPPPQAAAVSDSAISACSQALSARRGLVVDLAGGVGLVAPDARAQSARPGSAGLWLTPAWLGRNASLVGVVRGLWQDLQLDTSSFAVDVGARGVYAWDRYAVSAETVYRNQGRTGSRTGLLRVAVEVDAEVAGQSWLDLTFGKDFDAARPGSLLAIANLQWNLDKRRIQPDGLAAPAPSH